MLFELVVVSRLPDLVTALRSYDGVEVASLASLTRIPDLLAGERPPQALYLDARVDTRAALWHATEAALARRIPLLIGLHEGSEQGGADFAAIGVPTTTLGEGTALAAWIAAQLGLRARAGSTQVTIVFASPKGGVGKTQTLALLAEALRRRGVRLLVVDGDISNSGLTQTFRLPARGAAAYLSLREGGREAFTPANVRRLITCHQSGIDFLLAGAEWGNQDFTLDDWRALMQAVARLDGYDAVLIDTSPDVRKRPYALDAARTGGWVVVPAPPGRKERAGVATLLRLFASGERDLTARCLLVYMAPERGVMVTVPQVAPLFARQWPRTLALGTLPRSPQVISLADEEGDHYLSPLDVAPHSQLARATHRIADALCQATGLRPPHPAPRSSLWQRLWGERLPSLDSRPRWTEEVQA